MENLLGKNEETKLTLSEQTIRDLSVIKSWTYFFAILATIFFGLGLLGSIVSLFAGSLNQQNQLLLVRGFFVIIFMIAVYFYPIFSLFKFSSNMKHALAQKDNEKLSSAFSYLRSNLTYAGVLTIIFIVLYSIFLLFMLPAVLAIGMSGMS